MLGVTKILSITKILSMMQFNFNLLASDSFESNQASEEMKEYDRMVNTAAAEGADHIAINDRVEITELQQFEDLANTITQLIAISWINGLAKNSLKPQKGKAKATATESEQETSENAQFIGKCLKKFEELINHKDVFLDEEINTKYHKQLVDILEKQTLAMVVISENPDFAKATDLKDASENPGSAPQPEEKKINKYIISFKTLKPELGFWNLKLILIDIVLCVISILGTAYFLKKNK
jgi:hypothetical protein